MRDTQDLFYTSDWRVGMLYPRFQAGIYNEWLAENADASHALCARAAWEPRGKGLAPFSVEVMVDAPYGPEEITRAQIEARASLERTLDNARAWTREHALMFQAFPQLTNRTIHALWMNDYHTIGAVIDFVRHRDWRDPWRKLRELGPKSIRMVRQAVEDYLHACPELRYNTELRMEPVRVPCGCYRCKGKGQPPENRWKPQEHLSVFLETGTWSRPRGKSLGQLEEQDRAWKRSTRQRQKHA